MDLSDLSKARGEYRYVPARLISAGENNAALAWGPLRLAADVPSKEIWQAVEGRSAYSSVALDNYHKDLLNGEADSDLLHGLASAVFWGYASGADHRLHIGRSLARVHWLKNGKGKNIDPQPIDEILEHIRGARQLLRRSDLGSAFAEMMKIKFLGMSFASKILMFMDPAKAAGL